MFQGGMQDSHKAVETFEAIKENKNSPLRLLASINLVELYQNFGEIEKSKTLVQEVRYLI